jgi:RimJ/RimL family protein N-acetyltransferase
MLIGKKVRLRAIEREDLPVITTWFNDPATRRTLASYRPVSLADEQRWLEHISSSQTDQVFLIERVDDGSAPRPLGSCGIHRIDWKNRSCMVGILVGVASERGKGYGTDAMRTLVPREEGRSLAHRPRRLHVSTAGGTPAPLRGVTSRACQTTSCPSPWAGRP